MERVNREGGREKGETGGHDSDQHASTLNDSLPDLSYRAKRCVA
jgi:hypothetical protein